MKKLPLFYKILIGLFVVIAVLVIVIAFQPAHFQVERSVKISAPPAAVFSQVNTLKNWEAWNPWIKADPNIKNSYSGPPSGTGAVYNWAGNSEAGEGRMTIMESRPNEFIRFKLEFFKPMEGVSDAGFTFKAEGSQTEVTWSMSGENNFVAKAVGLFMSMDKMIGGSFEKGLAALKSVAEGGTKP